MEEEKTYSLLNNIHAYYIQPDIDALLADLYVVAKKRLLKPNNVLCYMLGLALRDHAERLSSLWTQSMFGVLPPPLVYAALWYSDTEEGRAIIAKDVNSDLGPVWRRWATRYAECQPPQEPEKGNNVLCGSGTPPTDQYMDELWANYYYSGASHWVHVILRCIDSPKDIREMLGLLSRTDNTQSLAELRVQGDTVYKDNKTLRTLFHSVLWDRNLLNAVCEWVGVTCALDAT